MSWVHRGRCPICHLSGEKGLQKQVRSIYVEIAGRSYPVSVAGYVCDGACDGKWHPSPEWGDGSRRSHKAYSMAWSQHRRVFLASHPACERCGVPASEAHHRVYRSQGGGDEFSNLEALCVNCHRLEHSSRRGGAVNGA